MASLVYIPNLKKDPDYPITTPFTFPLDPFQKHAVQAIDNEHNVLVCAKTGSGKTLVGEYQIHTSINKTKRVFYTTPIKSLSNQKFRDLKNQFPKSTVGIMTGDIKFCPDAQIVVMTTEILCNLLYKRGSTTEHLGLTASLQLDNLDAVIFDECHYINDKDRGHCWEETMILLPHDVKLVMLSATMREPIYFAEWLSKLRVRPICLIETTYRVVPLIHTVYNDDNHLSVIMNERNQVDLKQYHSWAKSASDKERGSREFREKVKEQRKQGVEGAIDGKVRTFSFTHRLNQLVAYLNTSNQTPALFFVLSRKQCEEYASSISEVCIDPISASRAVHIMKECVSKYKCLETSPQFHVLFDLAQKGVGFHHSGLSPLLKELTETLFEKGLIRVLFCTETFAVGLNMPTKTVVFVSVKKYDGNIDGLRVLHPEEYTQMAGRAGRRGKDILGTVIYFPDREPLSGGELLLMIQGQQQPIISRMKFRYEFLLKTLQSGTLEWLKILEKSYWFSMRQKDMLVLKNDLKVVNDSIKNIGLDELEMRDCNQRNDMEKNSVYLDKEKKKEYHRKLEQWKNRHMGPKWDSAWKRFFQLESFQAQKTMIEETITKMELCAFDMKPILEFLNRLGFLQVHDDIDPKSLDKRHLTLRGILATEVNEANPILMTELFLNKDFRAEMLTDEELIMVLSCLIREDSKDGNNAWGHDHEKVPAFDKLIEFSKSCEKLENEYHIASDLGQWTINLCWMYPILQWFRGENASAICAETGIFEGNFVKMVFKVGNVLDEWQSLAVYCQHVAQVEQISRIKQKLFRDIVVQDSLYLH